MLQFLPLYFQNENNTTYTQFCNSVYDTPSGIQEDEFLNSNDILPVEQSDIAQTNTECDIGSLEHFDSIEQYNNIDVTVNQFPNTNALAIEQNDVNESLWIKNMEGATTIHFPIPEHFDSINQYYDIDAMVDHFPSANTLAMKQSDVSECLWNENMVATTIIPFSIPNFGDMIEPKEDYYKEDVIDCLWE